MIEQMQERMDEQRLADAAELERQIRDSEERLTDLRMKQAALLAGNIQPVQTVADEDDRLDQLATSTYDQRNPNADLYGDDGRTDGGLEGGFDAVETFLDADDRAARQDFENQPDPFETT